MLYRKKSNNSNTRLRSRKEIGKGKIISNLYFAKKERTLTVNITPTFAVKTFGEILIQLRGSSGAIYQVLREALVVEFLVSNNKESI